MSPLETTKQWLIIHQTAGREIEVAACLVRIKQLERCYQKQDKPAFIDRLLFKCEGDLVDFRHKANRGKAYDHYYDDALEANIRIQAILDFKKHIYG